MDKILKDYCLSGKNNGLMLLDSPTGQGKTYAVLDFIYRNYESIKGKIIFITSLKKNLPYNDLKKMFEDNGKLYEFEKNVLFIDSNVDTLIANFDDVKNDIPSQFKDQKIFYQLENNIATIRKYEDSIKTRGKQKDKAQQEDIEFDGSYHLYEKAKQDLYDTWEQKFRDIIKRELSKLQDDEGKALSADKKIKLIEKDPQYSWIGKLYPAVFTKKRKIIFTSMDKFLARNATIVSPSYSFIDEKSITENSIIFIDEVDAAKDTMLTNIINGAISDKLGLLDLFQDIYDGLHTTEFTKALSTPSQNTLAEIANGKKWSVPEDLIKALREESAKIRTEFDLQHLFKLHSDEERSSFYLFQDYRFHNVFNGKKQVNILVDKKILSTRL